MSFYLAIVSPLDSPLFELSFPSAKPPPPSSSAAASGSGSGSATSSTSSFPSWSTFTASNGADLSQNQAQAQSQIPGQGQGQGHDGDANAARMRSGAQLGLSGGGGVVGGGEVRHGPERDRAMCQMIAHKSLDSVEEIMEGTGTLYFKNVDRHNEWAVSAFIATSVKFILLHDIKNDDGIRLFFLDVWEAYVKILLNPFHTVNTPIRNPAFEGKIRASAKRNL